METLHERIARVLSWTVAETQSMSLPSLIELVKPLSPKLAHVIACEIADGNHIYAEVHMDPNEVLAQILEDLNDMMKADATVVEDARESAVENLRNLADWLEKKGFAPNVQAVIEDLEEVLHPAEEDPDAGPPW